MADPHSLVVGMSRTSPTKIVWWVLCALALLWAVVPVSADTTTSPQQTEQPQTMATDNPEKRATISASAPSADSARSVSKRSSPSALAEGIITAFDLEPSIFNASSLRLTTADGQDITLAFNARKTKVWRQGQRLGADQLNPGDQVQVQYLEKQGQRIAQSVELLKVASVPQPTVTYEAPPPKPVPVLTQSKSRKKP